MPHSTPDTAAIRAARSPKKELNPHEPYLYLHEHEPRADGVMQNVNAIFLTNCECPFKCLMCDLWKHTLDDPTPLGAIPRQIEYALQRLPNASVVKLYNSGNFFDTTAIPPEDYAAIARLLASYDRVIVENHPKLCTPRCLEFAELLNGTLEIALGLETIHPKVLPRLNKKITTDDFKQGARFLRGHGLPMRTFLLLKPPYLTDSQQARHWAIRSARFAFDCGVDACSIIPTRAGNGIMEQLQSEGQFQPPTLTEFEATVDGLHQLNRGRIFADLWDLQRFSGCAHCFEARKQRLTNMNQTQQLQPHIQCENCS